MRSFRSSARAGIGKTRLALSIAHARRDAYRDGVWLIELAPVNDPALVVAEVARALGVSGKVDATVETVAAALAPRSLLLVLDNCEHVLDAVGDTDRCGVETRAASAPAGHQPGGPEGRIGAGL
jgi:predicted ATPase